jgi:hypothetical protein
MNKFIFTLSNEEITKIKVVDLEKLYNFIVKIFYLNLFRTFDLKFSLPSIKKTHDKDLLC